MCLLLVFVLVVSFRGIEIVRMNHPSVLAASSTPHQQPPQPGQSSGGVFLDMEEATKLQLAEEITRIEEEIERQRFEEEIKRMEDQIHVNHKSPTTATTSPEATDESGAEEEDVTASYDASESHYDYGYEAGDYYEEEEVVIEDDDYDEDDMSYEEEIVEEIVEDDPYGDEYEEYYEEEEIIEEYDDEEIVEYAVEEDDYDEGYEDFGGHESYMMQDGQDFNASAVWNTGNEADFRGNALPSLLAPTMSTDEPELTTPPPRKGPSFLGDIASAASKHSSKATVVVASGQQAPAPPKPQPARVTPPSSPEDNAPRPMPMKGGSLLGDIASAANARAERLGDDNAELRMKEVVPEIEAPVRPMDAFDLTAMVSKKARERETRLQAGGEKKMTPIKSKTEYKQDFKSIVLEAAQLGRLTRLNEHVVEAVALEKTQQEEWRSKGLLAIQWRNQAMAVIHEAARAGQASKLPEKIVSNCAEEEQDPEYDEHNATQKRISDRMKQLLELSTEVGTGQHKVDSLIMGRKEEKALDGRDKVVRSMDYYADAHDVKLPRRKAPKIDPAKEYEKITAKFKGTYRQDKPLSNISNEVAERAWSRRTRLDRPGSMPRVTEICNCPYCLDPSPYQTHAYKQKDLERKVEGYESPDSEEERQKARQLRRLERRKNRPQRGAPRPPPGSDTMVCTLASSTPVQHNISDGGGPVSVGNRARSYNGTGTPSLPPNAIAHSRGPPRPRPAGGDETNPRTRAPGASPTGSGTTVVKRRVRPRGAAPTSGGAPGGAPGSPTNGNGVVRRKRAPGAPGTAPRPTRATGTGGPPSPRQGTGKIGVAARRLSTGAGPQNSAGPRVAGPGGEPGTAVPAPGTRKVVRRRRKVGVDQNGKGPTEGTASPTAGKPATGAPGTTKVVTRRPARGARPGALGNAQRAPAARPVQSSASGAAPAPNKGGTAPPPPPPPPPPGASPGKVVSTPNGGQVSEQVIIRPDGTRVVRKLVTPTMTTKKSITKKVVVRSGNGRNRVVSSTIVSDGPQSLSSPAPPTNKTAATTTTTTRPIARRQQAPRASAGRTETASLVSQNTPQTSAPAPPPPTAGGTPRPPPPPPPSAAPSPMIGTPTVTVTREGTGRVVTTTTTTTTRKTASSTPTTTTVKRGLFGRKKQVTKPAAAVSAPELAEV